MSRTHLGRRSVLKGLGVAVASGLVVGTASGHSPALDEQLRTAEKRTAKYRKENGGIQRALDDGFQIMGPYVPAMGWHLVNFDRIAERERPGLGAPQGLTYNLDHELGSVEYAVPHDDDPPKTFSRGHDHRWHSHHSAQHVFATPGDEESDDPTDNYESAGLDTLLNPTNWVELSDESSMFPPEIDGLEVGDEVTLPWPPNFEVETRTVDGLVTHDSWWTLHAWVHFENPDGVFAPFNPAFDPFDPPISH